METGMSTSLSAAAYAYLRRTLLCSFCALGLQSVEYRARMALFDHPRAGTQNARKSKTMSERPNIILFFTDQHRLSGLGCYEDTPCLTPNIDRLSREGNRFETAYICCPLCTPARASVMTGLHVHGHG